MKALHLRSLTTRLIIAVVSTFAVILGVSILFISNFQEEQLLGQLENSASLLVKSIKHTLLHDMIKNEQDDVNDALRRVEADPRINRVVIVSPSGKIAFSSRRADLGSKLRGRLASTSCRESCHGPYPTRGYRTVIRSDKGGEGRYLRSVHYLRNERECTSCHDRKHEVLDRPGPQRLLCRRGAPRRDHQVRDRAGQRHQV